MKKRVVFAIFSAMLFGATGYGTAPEMQNNKITVLEDAASNASTSNVADTVIIVKAYNSSDYAGIFQNYREMSDGTWESKGITYQYRIELVGRMPNAARVSKYVVLSNTEDVTFDEVAKSFYSSDSHDWLNEQVTVVVEMY